jgi:hypothetical protein
LQIRGVNGIGGMTDWEPTNVIRILEVPIYLPGLEGIDLRGLSKEDILATLAKITKEQGAAGDYGNYDYDDAATTASSSNM